MAQRRIVGFDQDDVGDWVALLECGHRQHVRHRPPFQERPWVEDADGRAGRLGTPLECRVCDEESQGGEAPCLADRVCSSCGAVAGEPHRPGCDAVSSS
jgi:hypothetical protein